MIRPTRDARRQHPITELFCDARDSVFMIPLNVGDGFTRQNVGRAVNPASSRVAPIE